MSKSETTWKSDTYAEITKKMTDWWTDLPPERGPIEKYCLWWAKFTVDCLQGRKAQINAGSAHWLVVSKEKDDGVSSNIFSYEFTWDQTAMAYIHKAMLPEMHVWAVIHPNDCPDKRGQIIDFTTKFVLDLAKPVIPKADIRYEPLWCYLDELPKGVSYQASLQATELAHAILNAVNTKRVMFQMLEPLKG